MYSTLYVDAPQRQQLQSQTVFGFTKTGISLATRFNKIIGDALIECKISISSCYVAIGRSTVEISYLTASPFS